MTTASTPRDLRSELLAYLRAAIPAPGATYAEEPERFEAGVESTVVGFRLAGAAGAFAEPAVLRLYGQHIPGARVRFESTLQNAVADLGYAAPRVLVACETAGELGGPFTIMQRVSGALLAEPFTRRDTPTLSIPRHAGTLLFGVPRILGDLAATLHALDPEPVVRRLEAAGFPRDSFGVHAHLRAIAARTEGASLDGLRPGVDWLIGHVPAPPERLALCHGDLWFGNVLVSGRAVTGVIDWSMSMMMLGDPAYDIGVTNVGLMRSVPDLPGWIMPIARWAQQRISRRYLDAYRKRRPIDLPAVRYYEALRCIDMMSAVGERRAGVLGAMRSDNRPNMLDLPGSMDGFARHFADRTGIAVSLPTGN